MLTVAAVTARVAGSRGKGSVIQTCPYCAEEIQGQALVCRHCGHDLPEQEEELRQLRGPASVSMKWPLLLAGALSLLASGLIVIIGQWDSVSFVDASFSAVVESVGRVVIILALYFMLIFTPLGSLTYGISLLRNGEPVYRAIGLFMFLFLLFFGLVLVLTYLSPDYLGSYNL